MYVLLGRKGIYKADVCGNAGRGHKHTSLPMGSWVSARAAGTIQTTYCDPGKGKLKEQAGFLVSRSLTLYLTIFSTFPCPKKEGVTGKYYTDVFIPPMWQAETKDLLPATYSFCLVHVHN